jgi:hypothetical protein
MERARIRVGVCTSPTATIVASPDYWPRNLHVGSNYYLGAGLAGSPDLVVDEHFRRKSAQKLLTHEQYYHWLIHSSLV